MQVHPTWLKPRPRRGQEFPTRIMRLRMFPKTLLPRLLPLLPRLLPLLPRLLPLLSRRPPLLSRLKHPGPLLLTPLPTRPLLRRLLPRAWRPRPAPHLHLAAQRRLSPPQQDQTKPQHRHHPPCRLPTTTAARRLGLKQVADYPFHSYLL